MPSSPEDRDPLLLPTPGTDVDTERMALQARHRAPRSRWRRSWPLAMGTAAVAAVAGIAVVLAPAARERPAAADPLPTRVSAEPRTPLPGPTWRTASPVAPAPETAVMPEPEPEPPSTPVAPSTAVPPPQPPPTQAAPVADPPADACDDPAPGRPHGGRGNSGEGRGSGNGNAGCR